MCTDGDADAIAHQYFRGAQVTDANGQLHFDTCFPGWYPSRAVHIHFQVFVGGTRASIISQLFFPTTLNDEIFTTHADYSALGLPDTPNERDGIYTGVGTTGLVEYARMSDGAMLAWKQIVIT